MSPDPSSRLDEAELRAALGPRRPDPAAFRKGVERALERREAQRLSLGARLLAAPERLRMAASVLPPEIVGPAATGAAVVGKKLTLKAIPALFALPAVSLVMLLVTFVGGIRSLGRAPAGPARPDGDADAVVRDWWRRHKAVTQLIGLALIVLLVLKHSEAAVLVILASMACMVLILAELGRHGLATRDRIGRILGRMLMSIGLYAIFFGGLVRYDQGRLLVLLLVAGGLACLVLCRAVTWERIRRWILDPIPMRVRDPITTFSLRVLSGAFAVFLALVALGMGVQVVHWLLSRPPDRAELVRWVEGFDETDAKREDWDAWARVVASLQRDGGPPPALQRIVAAAEVVSAASMPRDEALVLVGLAGPEALRHVAGNLDVRFYAREDAPPLKYSHSTWLRSGLSAHLALGTLTPDEIERLAWSIEGIYPESDSPAAVSVIRRLIETQDRLGHPEFAGRHRQEALAAIQTLLSRWDGFLAANPPQWVSDLASLHDAVWLVERFDLADTLAGASITSQCRALARAGVYENQRLLRVGGKPAENVAAVTLRDLARFVPEPGVWERVLEQRVLLGTALLVALCLVATGRAPLELAPAEAQG